MDIPMLQTGMHEHPVDVTGMHDSMCFYVLRRGYSPEFKGSLNEPAPQPKAPAGSSSFARLLARGAGFWSIKFVHHSMPSRADTFYLQLSVSKHVIVFTVNFSIKLDQAQLVFKRSRPACAQKLQVARYQ